MTRDELWQVYVRRNPSFERAAKVTLSASGLRKLFEQTWEYAFEEGKKRGRNEKPLFEQIFGQP